MEGFRFFSF